MKKTKRILAVALSAAMLAGTYTPIGAYAAELPDYSVSADYAARYPNGVIELSNAEVMLDEDGEQTISIFIYPILLVN